LPIIYTPPAWVEVGTGSASGGGISNNAGYSYSYPFSIAIAPDGTPYATWSESNGVDSEIYVRRWNGNSWEEVGTGSASGGGISNNTGGSYSASLAIAPGGTPYIAWSDNYSGDYEIYIRHRNGSTWEEVGEGSATGGGVSNNADWSGSTSLAIAPDGTLYVAWSDESSGNPEIYIRHWNGSTWEEVGDGSATGGGVSNNAGWSQFPSLAFTPEGTPYAAWQNDYEIYIRRWNGSSWEEVGEGSATGGGLSSNSGISLVPSIAIAPDGTPYVIWTDDSSGNTEEIYVLRNIE
jgi:hypothetical protein